MFFVLLLTLPLLAPIIPPKAIGPDSSETTICPSIFFDSLLRASMLPVADVLTDICFPTI